MKHHAAPAASVGILNHIAQLAEQLAFRPTRGQVPFHDTVSRGRGRQANICIKDDIDQVLLLKHYTEHQRRTKGRRFESGYDSAVGVNTRKVEASINPVDKKGTKPQEITV